MKWRARFRHHKNMILGAAMDYREVLVTGGTGFVGTHVCRALIARGFLPRLLVRVGSEGKIPEDVRSACRVTPGDVNDREAVEYAAQGTMAIVHLVGIIREFPEPGVTFERLHVAATRNAGAAARRGEIPRGARCSRGAVLTGSLITSCSTRWGRASDSEPARSTSRFRSCARWSCGWNDSGSFPSRRISWRCSSRGTSATPRRSIPLSDLLRFRCRTTSPGGSEAALLRRKAGVRALRDARSPGKERRHHQGSRNRHGGKRQ